MKRNFSIAIDGPVGVGKGTLAVALAKKFNALYINTGAMYRALTLACLEKKVDIKNEKEILDLLKNSKIELRLDEQGSQKVFLNGRDVSKEIFLPLVSNTVAHISPFPTVRNEMVRKQTELAKTQDRVIIEGRDIATKVLPQADIKIFLTADINTRVQRRYRQMQKNNIDVSFEDILAETKERDRRDMERKTSPLIISKDAYVLDTTNLTVDQTVDLVMEKLKEKGIL